MVNRKLAGDASIQIVKKRRYGSVPEDLLEDKRLSMDARLVAAWLEIKPDGWIVNLGHLRRALGIPGDTVWSRIARELEGVGYLTRRRVQGERGRWGWEVSFELTDPRPTESGSPGFGEPALGSSVPGETDFASPEFGQPGFKTVPIEAVPDFKNTTTAHTGSATIEWPSATRLISNVERATLEALLDEAPDDADERQLLVNELAAKLESNEIRNGPVPYFRELVRRAKKGRFYPSAGLAISARQVRKSATEAALADTERQRAHPGDSQQTTVRQDRTEDVAEMKRSLKAANFKSSDRRKEADRA